MIKVAKKSRILLEKEKIPKIMKEFGCSRATVYNALSFRTNGGDARKIRDVAQNRYAGVLIKEPVIV